MIDPYIALEVMLEGPYPALWDGQAKREVLRFLRKRGQAIEKNGLKRLLDTILKGPSRPNTPDLSDKDWAGRRDRAIWLRLKKLSQSNCTLPKNVTRKIKVLATKHGFKLREDGSDEFSFFMGSGSVGQTSTGEIKDFSNMPIADFILWMGTQKDNSWDCNNGWTTFCDKHPKDALALLKSAGLKDTWIQAPWYDAMSRFHQHEKITKAHKRETVKTLLLMPTEVLSSIGTVTAWWLEKSWATLHKNDLWAVLDKLWEAAEATPCEGDLNLTDSLNHAGGILANVLISVLATYHPTVFMNKIYGMPKQLDPLFKKIGDGQSPAAILARIRMATSLLYLFRVTPEWTKSALLDRMHPDSETFEKTLWEGYLHSPRMHTDLLDVLKPAWVKVLENLDIIPEQARDNAVQLFIHTAVPSDQGIDTSEAKDVLYELDTQHLSQAAWALRNILESADTKAAVLWNETIEPWFKSAWPTDNQSKSENVSKNLAWMAIDAGDAFPNAVSAIETMLVAEKWESTIFHLQKTEEETGLISSSPSAANAALKMADKLVNDKTQTAGSALKKLLKVIAHTEPKLKSTKSYKRLSERLG